MSEKISAQFDEIVEAIGKKLLETVKDRSPEDVKTLAEAYEIARRAGRDW